MSKSKAKKRMKLAVERRVHKQRKPRKVQPCIEVEVRGSRRTKAFGTSIGMAIAEARRNKNGQG